MFNNSPQTMQTPGMLTVTGRYNNLSRQNTIEKLSFLFALLLMVVLPFYLSHAATTQGVSAAYTRLGMWGLLLFFFVSLPLSWVVRLFLPMRLTICFSPVRSK